MNTAPLQQDTAEINSAPSLQVRPVVIERAVWKVIKKQVNGKTSGNRDGLRDEHVRPAIELLEQGDDRVAHWRSPEMRSQLRLPAPRPPRKCPLPADMLPY